MSDSLAILTSKIQAILGDSGTIFTSATCTAAIRQTLHEFNQVSPQYLSQLITGVNDQYEYELSDLEPEAIHVIDVLLQGEGQNELDVSLDYEDYIEDERVYIRLDRSVTSSDTLIVHYTKNHTINGLDSQVESTIQFHDQIIVDGAAYHAIMIRAASRIETINLSQDQSDNYREIATHFRNAYNAGLSALRRRKRRSVGEPDSRSWNDRWHNWDQ